MFVARNRQRPPEENAFAKRARTKREAAASAEAPAAPAVAVSGEVSELSVPAVEAPADVAGAPVETTPTTEHSARRGRPRSAAVEERNAKVLELVGGAQRDGIAKSDIAELLGEKEQQVYTSLRQLAQDGKVESRNVPEAGEYRWFAL